MLYNVVPFTVLEACCFFFQLNEFRVKIFVSYNIKAYGLCLPIFVAFMHKERVFIDWLGFHQPDAHFSGRGREKLKKKNNRSPIELKF